MLSIRDYEHFDKVMTKAQKMGLEEDLKQKLNYLEHYRGDECVCILFPDWAPLSFEFVLYHIEEKWQPDLKREDPTLKREPEKFGKRWFNGGLIYHGPVDGKYTDPLSVEINPSNRPHWSIHT